MKPNTCHIYKLSTPEKTENPPSARFSWENNVGITDRLRTFY